MDVRKVVEYTHRNLLDPVLTVGKIGDVLGFHNDGFSTLFAYHVGAGLKEYILRHRIALAKRLLPYDQVKVYEVAHAVGYRNHNAFSMAFKAAEGCSPSQFRESLKGKLKE